MLKVVEMIFDFDRSRLNSKLLSPWEFLNNPIKSVKDSTSNSLLTQISLCQRMGIYSLSDTPRIANKDVRKRNKSILTHDTIVSEMENWQARFREEEIADMYGAVFNDPITGLPTQIDALEILREEDKKVLALFLQFPQYHDFKSLRDNQEEDMSLSMRKQVLLSHEILAANGYDMIGAAVWYISHFGGNFRTVYEIVQRLIVFDEPEKREASDLYYEWVSNVEQFRKKRILPTPEEGMGEVCKKCNYRDRCICGKRMIQELTSSTS